MDYEKEALRVHQENKGKMAITGKIPVKNKDDLSIIYTPGVAEPCRQIHKEKSLVYDYTIKGNFIAVITDGSAVLGLGDLGPEASLPVMEGKCILFKEFGGVDAVPLCLATKDVDELVNMVTKLQPAFGGYNLEDIAAPRCFELERRLKETLDIPVFHDDQHGTAVTVLAGLINSLKIVGKEFADVQAVVNGAGAAGIAITGLLKAYGMKDVVLCDTNGAIYRGRPKGMNLEKEKIALETNIANRQGSLKDVLIKKDIFIGVSVPGVVTKEMIQSMNQGAIVFAMANPIPEIMPDEAKAAGARIVGTGRSDFPNQVNNVLAFPGIFRGALDVRAREINDAMKIAAARAIAEIAAPEMNEGYVLPQALNREVGPRVAAAVAEAAVKSGAARIMLTYEEEYANATQIMNKSAWLG